ncbi:hypothetical protein FOQG_14774 [Fusarium oxysporum f. sp. raphani 54005]|uniref:Cytochrome P450 n=2 Tax=Fusarium oxysporum TaxID=5507 RepID=X0CDN1_FUSOX|nr:hypothetical protein FOVG_18973 [Fusarium oxysporum f. sp. pisi HDV247]EXK80727.1 hypothetical protein FOQG_14774 [Fusarium oxysporum f. sp. raphani 54005]
MMNSTRDDKFTFFDMYSKNMAFSQTAIVVSFAAILVYAFRLLFKGKGKRSQEDIPYGLKYLNYLPRWVCGIMYSRNALGLMVSARAKYPDAPYKLPRLDTDIVMLPSSVLEELAGLPNAIASNILALQYDLVAAWTGLSMLQDVNLHLRVVQRRLSPNMRSLTLDLEEEVTNAVGALFPQTSNGEWAEMDLYHVMMEVSSRVFSRMVVGPHFCRDPKWVDFAMNFTENVFNSIVFIRNFPAFLHPILRYTLPSVTKAIDNIRQVEELMVPVFTELLKLDSKSNLEKGGSPEHGPLNWFLDIASGDERDPVKLVHAQILLALGAVHTSLFSEINVLYDLMSNPSYFEVIRDEIQEVSDQGWSVDSYAKLHKLDSILRESQRMSPPFLTGLRRVMKQDYTFSNGISVHEGQYICIHTIPDQSNGATGVYPKFDGLRSYNLKAQEGSWKTASHQFGTTEISAIGFGHGRTACPGRYLASLGLKIIFTKLLSEYNFKFTDGSKGRPLNRMVHEIVFPDPTIKVMVQRRENASTPF